MAKFKVGDRVVCHAYSAATFDGNESEAYEGVTGTIVDDDGSDYRRYRVKLDAPIVGFGDADLWRDSDKISPAAPSPIAVNLGIDLNLPAKPQVGDDVLIFGTIAGINHSPRGTNYNIVFETQNRRMSLHFLDEDFILFEDDGSGDCVRADNDNGTVPSTDTAKAFDAMGTWLRSLAVQRAA